VKDPLEDASVDVDRRGAAFILIAIVLGLAGLAILRPGSRDALAIVVGIVAMVMLHEAGHYITAKRAGMKVTEFFVGFGPRLWSFRRGETEYGVKAILVGGYVRIVGMTNLEQPIRDEETGEWVHGYSPDDEPRTFRRGSFKNRLIVVLAGVTVNALLAFVLFYAVIVGHGINDLSTRISSVEKKLAGGAPTAANKAGFKKGDRIVAVDGHRIADWEALKSAIESRAHKATTFTVVRHSERLELHATPTGSDGAGFLGVSPSIETRAVGAFDAIGESFKTMGDITVGTANGIGHIFSPSGLAQYSKNFTSNAPKSGSAADRARPRSLVGIVDEASGIVHGDLWALLWVLGGISLILALFNTLPLLPFDGGHAAVVLYEWIASKLTRRSVRVDYRRLMPMTVFVLAVFLTLGLSAMFLDFRQAFGS
jgi:membrane-associated protease RseP (regulator of RpoE activity)